MKVTSEQTRRIAHLARLELSDEEVETFTPQLSEILSYVQQLQSIDLTNIEPLTYPLDASTPLRADEVREFALTPEGQPKILGCAPEVLNDGFKVPPVL